MKFVCKNCGAILDETQLKWDSKLEMEFCPVCKCYEYFKRVG